MLAWLRMLIGACMRMFWGRGWSRAWALAMASMLAADTAACTVTPCSLHLSGSAKLYMQQNLIYNDDSLQGFQLILLFADGASLNSLLKAADTLTSRRSIASNNHYL